MNDLISRQTAINMFEQWLEAEGYSDGERNVIGVVVNELKDLPSAQSEAIPVEWIDNHLEWLDNCDNDFAQLAKVSIRAMVELWKKDKI